MNGVFPLLYCYGLNLDIHFPPLLFFISCLMMYCMHFPQVWSYLISVSVWVSYSDLCDIFPLCLHSPSSWYSFCSVANCVCSVFYCFPLPANLGIFLLHFSHVNIPLCLRIVSQYLWYSPQVMRCVSISAVDASVLSAFYMDSVYWRSCCFTVMWQWIVC